MLCRSRIEPVQNITNVRTNREMRRFISLHNVTGHKLLEVAPFEYFRTISLYAADAFIKHFVRGNFSAEERPLLHVYNMTTYMNIRDCCHREHLNQTECEL